VAVAGCRHRTETAIERAGDSRLFWVEITVLGRYGEGGGEVWHRRSVDIDGRPFQRQAVSIGKDDRRPSDPAVLGGARVVASGLVAHPEWAAPDRGVAPVVTVRARAGVLPLGADMAEIVGLGETVDAVFDAWTTLANSMVDTTPRTAAALVRYVEANR
jgi:hypothetical protein